jgi:hypothetical protein
MHPPREWTEKWARENPRAAIVVLVFGAVQIGFVIWLFLSDGCRP